MIPHFHRKVVWAEMTARAHNLTPHSALACLLSPNTDIAMFAGRAAPRGEQALQRGYVLTLSHTPR
jgi:hypothetical protein